MRTWEKWGFYQSVWRLPFAVEPQPPSSHPWEGSAQSIQPSWRGQPSLDSEVSLEFVWPPRPLTPFSFWIKVLQFKPNCVSFYNENNWPVLTSCDPFAGWSFWSHQEDINSPFAPLPSSVYLHYSTYILHSYCLKIITLLPYTMNSLKIRLCFYLISPVPGMIPGLVGTQ